MPMNFGRGSVRDRRRADDPAIRRTGVRPHVGFKLLGETGRKRSVPSTKRSALSCCVAVTNNSLDIASVLG